MGDGESNGCCSNLEQGAVLQSSARVLLLLRRGLVALHVAGANPPLSNPRRIRGESQEWLASMLASAHFSLLSLARLDTNYSHVTSLSAYKSSTADT
jgi:hypothetical protein